VGEWKDNQFHDKAGVYQFQNGDQYGGEFREGKLSGQGVYTFQSGAKFVGEFKDDKRNGQGVYFFPTWSKATLTFKDDILKESFP